MVYGIDEAALAARDIFPGMDPLSDVLRIVRLDGAFFYPVETESEHGMYGMVTALVVKKSGVA